MRERLIEVLKGFSYECRKPCGKPSLDSMKEYIKDCNECKLGQIADYLLANGVIVPPCKVGDTVYVLDAIVDKDICENCESYYEGGMGDLPACNKGKCGNRAKECIEIKEVLVTQKELYWWLYMEAFGETVFLTKEEAEQKLKERESERG